LTSRVFAGIEKNGANPSVFYYQVHHNVIELSLVMRLVFFEGSCVTLVFS
jgi:hypothetical protein